jgi:hypothetical protein
MALRRIVGFALTSRDGGRASVAQIGLAAALAVGMTCASAAVARAGDYDDPSGASFGSQMLKAIGLPDPDHPEYEINYSEPDRSTAGLPNAIPGSTIWNSAGSQASEGVHPRRAHGDTAITCAVSLAPR